MTDWARRMNERQAAGLCRACGRPQVPGRTLCEAHLRKQSERRMVAYRSRLAAGLCVEPKCGRAAAPDLVCCRECHAKRSDYQRRYYKDRRSS